MGKCDGEVAAGSFLSRRTHPVFSVGETPKRSKYQYRGRGAIREKVGGVAGIVGEWRLPKRVADACVLTVNTETVTPHTGLQAVVWHLLSVTLCFETEGM